MKRLILFFIGLALAAGVWQASPATAADVVNIGSRRELFVDRYLIDRLQNTELRLGTPVDHGPVLQLDKSWEGAFSGYFTVIHDQDVYRMYYRGNPNGGTKDGTNNEVTAVAESKDGVHWIRPDLGLFEVRGTKKNNVILADDAPFSHNFSPMLDTRPGVPASERYKALAGIQKTGLVPFVSSDGIHWRKLLEQAVIPPMKEPAFDSQNLVFRSETEGAYICYFRTFKKIGNKRYRWVSRTTSKDFLQWTTPEEMTYGDAEPEELYTNQTSPYFRAPHIYASICARFVSGRQVLTEEQARELKIESAYFRQGISHAISDAVFVTSRGGNRYDRTFMEGFIRPGIGLGNWVPRSNYPALNVVQTSPTEMSFYVQRNYGQPTHYVRRYGLRLDGFGSLHASYKGGEALTRPFRFAGNRLEINYSTSAAGSVRIELQDENGNAIPGYSLADSQEIYGDEISRTVSWKDGKDVTSLAGKTIRLRFVLKDADVYAFKFGN